MTKNEETQKQKPKAPVREMVGVRLLPDTINLARSLSKTYHGDEKKMGLLIEDALNFYAAHKEDEGRANALLKTTEDILFKRFTEQVDQMYKQMSRENDRLFQRLGKLSAVSSFETALSELMMKEVFFSKDDKTKARYEELRSVAAKKMKDKYEGMDAEEILNLTKKIQDMTQYMEKLEQDLLVVCAERDTEKKKADSYAVGIVAHKKKLVAAKEQFEKAKRYADYLWQGISWMYGHQEDQNKGILGKRPDINTCWRAYQGEHKNPGKPEENFDWDVR